MTTKPPPPQGSDMNQIMLDELSILHGQFIEIRERHNTILNEALQKVLLIGELINKTKDHHRSNTTQFLRDTIPDDDQRAYIAAAYAASKRPLSSDKRCLQALGLMAKQPPRPMARKTRSAPTLTSNLNKASVAISSSLEGRPVESMSAMERQQLKAQIRHIAELFVKLSQNPS